MIHLPALINGVLEMFTHLGAHHVLWEIVGNKWAMIWSHHWLVSITWRQ